MRLRSLEPKLLGALGTWVLLCAAAIVPFVDIANGITGRDLHLTAGLIGLAALLALARTGLDPASAGWGDRLDLLAGAFLLYGVFHYCFLGISHPRASKGLLIENRFAIIYLTGRGLGVGNEYLRRMLTILLICGVAVAFFGLLEYFTRWGALLAFLDQFGESKYWKRGIPRLYSLVITPVGTAYFLYAAICAAAARWLDEARLLPTLAVAGALIAIPLTLTRSVVAWVAMVVVGLAAKIHPLRSFLAMTAVCALLALLIFQLSGRLPILVGYASGSAGGVVADRSVVVHRRIIGEGVAALVARPLGYGFGQAGALASREGGIFPYNETYFITLAVQAGVPALLLILAFLESSFMVALRAIGQAEPGPARGGVFILALLFGVFVGSLFLPIASKAWVQVYLFTAVAALVNQNVAAKES